MDCRFLLEIIAEQVQTYLNFLARSTQPVVKARMTPTIPNHQPKLPGLTPPGTGTFMPNKPAIRFNGTKIVAKTVILPSNLFALEPFSVWLRVICVRWLEWLRLSIFSKWAKLDIMVTMWSWTSERYSPTSPRGATMYASLHFFAKPLITSALPPSRRLSDMTVLRHRPICWSVARESSNRAVKTLSSIVSVSRSISSGEACRPPQADSRRVLVASVRVVSPK